MYFLRFFCLFLCIAFSMGCLRKSPITADPQMNFDVFWQEVNEKYGLFNVKNIDWQAVREKYITEITPHTNLEKLFQVLSSMMQELKDGHTALITPFGRFTYDDFFLRYPPNYDDNIVERYYLSDKKRVFGGVLSTRVLVGEGNTDGPIFILYIRYPSFLTPLSGATLDLLLSYIAQLDIQGIILDIRDNTGGNIEYAQNLAGLFQEQAFTAGYIRFKTGTGHNDFGDFSPILTTTTATRRFTKPVALLTNRMVYSAANFFAGAMKQLPNVRIIGDTTGGGGGLPYSNSLPIGWQFSISVSELFDPQKAPLELGVAPHIRADLHTTFADKKDNVIDTAYQILHRKITTDQW